MSLSPYNLFMSFSAVSIDSASLNYNEGTRELEATDARDVALVHLLLYLDGLSRDRMAQGCARLYWKYEWTHKTLEFRRHRM